MTGWRPSPSFGLLVGSAAGRRHGYLRRRGICSGRGARRSRESSSLPRKGNMSAKLASKLIGHLDESYIAACQLGHLPSASLGARLGSASPSARWGDRAACWHLRRRAEFAPATAHAVAIAVAFTIITAAPTSCWENWLRRVLPCSGRKAPALWIARPLHTSSTIALRWPICRPQRRGQRPCCA
jgi:hypothetical protein